MSGFAGVVAVVLSQMVAGSVAISFVAPLWRETKRTYFTLHGVAVTLLFAVWAWTSASAGAVAGDQAGPLSARLALVTLVVLGASTLAFVARMWTIGRIVGMLSVLPAVATLAALAGTGRQGYLVSLLQLLVGAAFLGAAFHGLFLGHWYLTDRKLSRTPISRATVIFMVATCFEFVSIVTGGFEGTGSSASFNPLLTAGALAPWIAIGMAVTTLAIALLVKAALRSERSAAVQSATGFYYLAVVTAITGEIAVKTRFFPT